jgi:hypothetical protein
MKKLDNRMLPTGMASGCIIQFQNEIWLLSVFHAVGEDNWGIEIEFNKEKKNMLMLYPLSGFSFLKSINIKTLKIDDVDFAFRKLTEKEQSYLPLKFQEISLDGKINNSVDKHIVETNLNVKPTDNHIYGFAGLVQGKYMENEGQITLQQSYTIETDLIYNSELDNGIYVFTLNKTHPGHEYYQGCSGAPIIDKEGNIVSLLIGGDIEKNEIYGINLNTYKIAIEAENIANK